MTDSLRKAPIVFPLIDTGLMGNDFDNPFLSLDRNFDQTGHIGP